MKKRYYILFVILLVVVAGCGERTNNQEKPTSFVETQTQQEQNQPKTETTVEPEQISEEEINKIIDEMEEWGTTISLTEELKKEIRENNLKVAKKVKIASNFNIREYKDYWIIEDPETRIGLRYPYDTRFETYEGDKNTFDIYRPMNDNDLNLECWVIFVKKSISLQDAINKEDEDEKNEYMEPYQYQEKRTFVQTTDSKTIQGWQIYNQINETKHKDMPYTKDGLFLIGNDKFTYYLVNSLYRFGKNCSADYDAANEEKILFSFNE